MPYSGSALSYKMGAQLRDRRSETRQRGLGQGAVALDARMQPSWLLHLEAGRRDPSWSTVQRVGTALGVRVSELVVRAEEFELAESRNSVTDLA